MKRPEALERVKAIRRGDEDTLRTYRSKFRELFSDLISEVPDTDQKKLIDSTTHKFAQIICEIYGFEIDAFEDELKIKEALQIVQDESLEKMFRSFNAAKQKLRRNGIDVDSASIPSKFRTTVDLVKSTENISAFRKYNAAISLLRYHQIDRRSGAKTAT